MAMLHTFSAAQYSQVSSWSESLPSAASFCSTFLDANPTEKVPPLFASTALLVRSSSSVEEPEYESWRDRRWAFRREL